MGRILWIPKNQEFEITGAKRVDVCNPMSCMRQCMVTFIEVCPGRRRGGC